ncbi:MAG: alpha/beta hydrolase [Actinomycetota bacterium]|nr:alpha/beta hydrolase [Actinomycetota bacterium]
MAERVQIAGPRGQLEVALSGPSDGQALLFHTGTPSGGAMFRPLVEIGAQRGLRHVVYSRPGYGGSERCAGRSVADCAPDVAAIADALGIERFFVAGGSGGGPHVLACAALLPERVIAAATIASVAPRFAEGLNWLDGMGAENLEEEAAAEAGPQQLLAFLEPFREKMMSATGRELYAVLGDLLSEVDRRVLTGEYAEHLAEGGRAGLAPGVYGWFDDDLAFIRDWGFDLQDVSRPVTIWQGAQDRMVPPAHGTWLAANVPGARAKLLPDHGHLSLSLALYGEILDDLIASAN